MTLFVFGMLVAVLAALRQGAGVRLFFFSWLVAHLSHFGRRSLPLSGQEWLLAGRIRFVRYARRSLFPFNVASPIESPWLIDGPGRRSLLFLLRMGWGNRLMA